MTLPALIAFWIRSVRLASTYAALPASGQRDRDVHPSAALTAADPHPDERPEQRVIQIALLDYPAEDLLGNHQDER